MPITGDGSLARTDLDPCLRTQLHSLCCLLGFLTLSHQSTGHRTGIHSGLKWPFLQNPHAPLGGARLGSQTPGFGRWQDRPTGPCRTAPPPW